MPMVPCPAITSGSSKGCTNTRLRSARELERVLVRGVEHVAVEHDFTAEARNGGDLDLRRGGRHHDHGADAAVARREGHALRVIAGGCADDAASRGRFGKIGDLVVRTADLEREHRLQVLALQQDLTAEPRGETLHAIERRRLRHVIDAGLEDALDVVVGNHATSLRESRPAPLRGPDAAAQFGSPACPSGRSWKRNSEVPMFTTSPSCSACRVTRRPLTTTPLVLFRSSMMVFLFDASTTA